MLTYNSLIPELLVSDFEKSLKFYVSNLGFKIEYSRTNPSFAFLSKEKNQIMIEGLAEKDNWILAPAEFPFGRGMNLQIEINDAVHLYNQLKQNGTKFFRDLTQKRYAVNNSFVAQTEFIVPDPDGYLLRFISRIPL